MIDYGKLIADFSAQYSISEAEFVALLKREISNELNLVGDVFIEIKSTDRKLKFYELSNNALLPDRNFRLSAKTSNIIFKNINNKLSFYATYERKKFIKTYCYKQPYIVGKIIKEESYGFTVDTSLGQAFLPIQNITSILDNYALIKEIKSFVPYCFYIKKLKFKRKIIPKIILAYDEKKILNYLINKYIEPSNLKTKFINKKTGDILVYVNNKLDEQVETNFKKLFIGNKPKILINKQG